MKISSLLFLSSLPIVLSLSACANEPRTVVVRRTVVAEAPSPRVVTVSAPVASTVGDNDETVIVEDVSNAPEVIVTSEPPAPIREVIVVRPSPRHVWISGYWRWAGARYVWVGGHWSLPPRDGCVWVGPRVVVRHGARVYVGGCWHAAHHHRRH